jgi:hypothetical protein
MAFLRQEKKESGTYLRIVQSYRSDDGKSKHRTLYNLGKAEDYSPSALKKIGQALYELGGGAIEELEHKMLHEICRFYYGFHFIVKQLLKTYSLDVFFNGLSRNKNLGFSMLDSITLLISERLHDPVSKLSNYKNQSDYIGLKPLELHQIYRSLDYLYDNQEPIKQLFMMLPRFISIAMLKMVFVKKVLGKTVK